MPLTHHWQGRVEGVEGGEVVALGNGMAHFTDLRGIKFHVICVSHFCDARAKFVAEIFTSGCRR